MNARKYLIGLAATVIFIAIGLLLANRLPAWVNGAWGIAAVVLAWWFGVKAFKFAFRSRDANEGSRSAREDTSQK